MSAIEIKEGIHITDITNVVLSLNKDINVAAFNPSIVHIRDNEYIISIRVNGETGDNHEHHPITATFNHITTTFDKRHPWNTFWKNPLDGTIFMACTIDMDTKKIVESRTLQVELTTGITENIIKGVDARLFKSGDLLYLTYNKFTDNKIKISEVSSDTGLTNICQFDYCANMVLDIFTMTSIGASTTLRFKNRSLMCKPKQQQIEKNWTIFDNGKLNISYGLSGKHVFFNDIANKFSSGFETFTHCEEKDTTSSITQMLKNIEDRTKFGDQKVIHFSLSTPAVRYNETSNIAIGHVKLNHQHISNVKYALDAYNDATSNKYETISWKKQLYLIITEFENHINIKASSPHVKHPIYMYFMFFYKLNLQGEITDISNVFVPYNNEPYSLVFASGLAMTQDKSSLIISYGVADVQSKLAFFPTLIVDNMLKKPTNNLEWMKLIIMTKSTTAPMEFGGGKIASKKEIRKKKKKENTVYKHNR